MSSTPQSALAPEHVNAIEALMEETRSPLEKIAQLYLAELSKLQTGARIQDYLVVLTSRRVREALSVTKRARFLEASAFNPSPNTDLR
jgi:hypothetical protein